MRRVDDQQQRADLGDSGKPAFEDKFTWIHKHIRKEQCVAFIPTELDPELCGCGYAKTDHSESALAFKSSATKDNHHRWTLRKHTRSFPTDAFGTIRFQVKSSRSRSARYIRLSYDTQPLHVLHIISEIWEIPIPKIVVSVIGGSSANFEMPDRSKRIFDRGLLDVVRASRVWFLSNGLDVGVGRRVGDAFEVPSPKLRQKTICIGFAHWGHVAGRDSLIGIEKDVYYNPMRYRLTNETSPVTNNNCYTLNPAHTHFILVDNGSRLNSASTHLFRKAVERFLVRHVVNPAPSKLLPETRQRIPAITIAMEGNAYLTKDILECITQKPLVPVIVHKQSGGFAEVVSYLLQNDKEANDEMMETLSSLLESDNSFTSESVLMLKNELNMCLKLRQHISVFDDAVESDFSECIFKVLLKNSTMKAVKLDMALRWNQYSLSEPEICHIKEYWPDEMIYDTLTDALVDSNFPLVRMFFDQGISETEYLTSTRLEDLYNRSISRKDTVHVIMKGMRKHYKSFVDLVTLVDIGHLFEKLMGFGFKSTYTRATFINRHFDSKCESHQKWNPSVIFAYPYTELLIWAVLTKRHSMAKFFWERGKQPLVKALIAMKLNIALAKEANQDELDPGIAENFREYAEEFAKMALEFRDKCYAEDPENADQLVLHEVKNLGEWTCLFLAEKARHRELIARSECQVLLSDLWMGGMNERKWLEWKVFAAIFVFPFIPAVLEYKTERELEKMAQTEEEHQQEMLTSSDSSSSDSSSSDDEDGLDVAPNFRYYRSHRRNRRISERSSNSVMRRSVQNQNSSIIYGPPEFIRPMETIKEVCPPPVPEMEIRLADYSSESDDDRKSCTSTIDSEAHNEANKKKRRFCGYKIPYFSKRRGELSAKKKAYEFINAPVTKFVLCFISHTLFLLIYCYMILDTTEPKMKPAEIYVNVHLFSLAVDMYLEFLKYPVRSSNRLWIFFSSRYRWMFVVIESVHVAALVCRFSGAQNIARLIYCVCVLYWFIQLFPILAITRTFASLIYIAQKNIYPLMVMSVLVALGMTGFGVFRQAVKYPLGRFSSQAFVNIFVEPYYMLYGEVYADTIAPTCENPEDPGCAYGHWVTIVVMVFYMLLCQLLLLNILGAKFTSTFARISSQSDLYYKFQRYANVTYYESKSRLPPPLVVFSLIHYVYKSVKRNLRGVPKPYDEGLKVYLSDNEVEDLEQWEEVCLEEYFFEKTQAKSTETDGQIHQMQNCLTALQTDVSSIKTHCNHTKLQLDSISSQFDLWQDKQDRNMSVVLSNLNLVDNTSTAISSSSSLALPKRPSNHSLPSWMLLSPRTSIGNEDEHRIHAKIVNRVLRKQIKRAGFSPPPCWARNKRVVNTTTNTTTTNNNEGDPNLVDKKSSEGDEHEDRL